MKFYKIHPLATAVAYPLLLAFVLFLQPYPSLMAQGARMNGQGHFPGAGHRPKLLSRTTHPGIDTLHLLGATVMPTVNGYLTLDGLYENAPVEMRIYSPSGELRYQKQYRQMMNLQSSPNGRYVAFHDMERIHVFNTVCLNAKTVEGSNVFAVDNAYNVAAYDASTESVEWMGIRHPVQEAIYKVVIREGQPLFIGYKSVWQVGPEGLVSVFTAPAGRLFDAAVDSLTLHLSTKVEHPCQFDFMHFTSTDLQNFQQLEQQVFPLAHCQHDMAAIASAKTTTDELIRDPLHFYDNSYAQPIGNSYNEIQEYSQGSPYPHPGVDLLGNYQDSVHSVHSGFVKAVLTTAADWHWRVAIANSNTAGRSQGYLYAHVQEASIPYVVGDPINLGDVLGLLVDWPVAGFSHCHFARISGEGGAWIGDWWTLDNPLKFMTNITDNLAPEFENTLGNDLFAFREPGGAYQSPTALSGNLRVIARFHDRINSIWHVDVDKIRYSLSPLANPTVMLIDTQAHEFNHWNDNYAAGPYYLDIINTLYSRDLVCFSQGNYDFRDFYHIVTNSDGLDSITVDDSNQYLRTVDFPDGDYIFRVTAIDPFGLQTTDSMVITFANGPASADANVERDGIVVYPNPSGNGIYHVRSERPLRYEVVDVLGQTLLSGKLSGNEATLDLSAAASGIYWLRATDGKRRFDRRLVLQAH